MRMRGGAKGTVLQRVPYQTVRRAPKLLKQIFSHFRRLPLQTARPFGPLREAHG